MEQTYAFESLQQPSHINCNFKPVKWKKMDIYVRYIVFRGGEYKLKTLC